MSAAAGRPCGRVRHARKQARNCNRRCTPIHADGTWATASARLARAGSAIPAVNDHAGFRPIGVHRCASVVAFACFAACRAASPGWARHGTTLGEGAASLMVHGVLPCMREAAARQGNGHKILRHDRTAVYRAGGVDRLREDGGSLRRHVQGLLRRRRLEGYSDPARCADNHSHGGTSLGKAGCPDCNAVGSGQQIAEAEFSAAVACGFPFEGGLDGFQLNVRGLDAAAARIHHRSYQTAAETLCLGHDREQEKRQDTGDCEHSRRRHRRVIEIGESCKLQF